MVVNHLCLRGRREEGIGLTPPSSDLTQNRRKGCFSFFFFKAVLNRGLIGFTYFFLNGE